MKRIVTLSYVLIGVAVALAMFLLWQYQSLSATVKRQRQEIHQQSEAISKNDQMLQTSQALVDRQRKEIENNKLILKMNETNLMAILSASIYIEDGSGRITGLGARFKELCGKNIEYDAVMDFCRIHGPSIDLVASLTKALQTRISAPQADRAEQAARYRQMQADYRAMAEFLKAFADEPWTKSWRALAFEGMAYADLKLGRLPEAEKAIRQAVASNSDDAGVRITALKIMCVQQRPADRVKADFAALRRRLEARVADAPRNTEEGRRARRERDLFLRDAELYHLCSHAQLAPAAPRADHPDRAAAA